MSRCAVAGLLFAMLAVLPASAGERAVLSPEAVVRLLFDAFNRHDLHDLSMLYDDDAVLLSPDHPQPLHGPAGARAIHAPLFARFPDVEDRIVTVIVQGDRVAVEFVSHGCAVSGHDCFELPIVSVLTVRRGRIVRDVSYFDVPTVGE